MQYHRSEPTIARRRYDAIAWRIQCHPEFQGAEAECAAVGGTLDFFESSFDAGCPVSLFFMSEFTTGVCFDPHDGSCLDNSGISQRSCDALGGVFLGFPTYSQVASRPIWADPVPFGPFASKFPARQWIEAEYPESGPCCARCR